ncbi:MAG TPA: TolC family protein [Longimicrobium sp.]|nr:TolC family protein [Longimicrobium sp.]
MRARLSIVLIGVALVPAVGAAQQRVTLEQARAAALANGTRISIAAADEAAARADLLTARAFPNPTVAADYSKSPPQYHLTADQPLEFPWLRGARIRAARAGALGARYRLEIERAAVRFAVDSAYVQAAAARELYLLSARTEREGDELVRIARARQQAGDASELDVELALVAQGGLQGAALADSLAAIAALLDLQALMGIPSTHPTIVLADSLASLPALAPAAAATADATAIPLRAAAAEADVQARTASIAVERANRWAAPSITGGVEWHDPTGGEKGYLPTFGLSVPLPLWDRNRGPIAAAQAGLQRARAELLAAQREGAAALAAAERARAAAAASVERGRALLAHAERVVALSTQGYREGAFPITTVIDARRAARDVLRQYVQDLAALRAAESAAALARTVGAAP